MSEHFIYSDSLDSATAADLEGFLSHWDFTPPAGTLLQMLKGSSLVIFARESRSSRICGYVAALSDQVVCGYISAIEVRPEHRKQGIGTELLNRMTERLNVNGIYLSCAPAMIPFYESAGFKQVAGMTKRRLPVAIEA
jgi:ribosomal protein S18 acetylase RimI-like enzyme